jgi:hypothetical protein
LVFVFALATVTSVIALTVRGEHPNIDPRSGKAVVEALTCVFIQEGESLKLVAGVFGVNRYPAMR